MHVINKWHSAFLLDTDYLCGQLPVIFSWLTVSIHTGSETPASEKSKIVSILLFVFCRYISTATVNQWELTSAVRIFKISNRIDCYFSIRFDSKRAQLFEIFEYLPTYLFNRMMLIFYHGNHTQQPTKSVVINGPGPVSP